MDFLSLKAIKLYGFLLSIRSICSRTILFHSVICYAAVATTNFDLHEVGAALSIGMTVSIGGRSLVG